MAAAQWRHQHKIMIFAAIAQFLGQPLASFLSFRCPRKIQGIERAAMFRKGTGNDKGIKLLVFPGSIASQLADNESGFAIPETLDAYDKNFLGLLEYVAFQVCRHKPGWLQCAQNCRNQGISFRAIRVFCRCHLQTLVFETFAKISKRFPYVFIANDAVGMAFRKVFQGLKRLFNTFAGFRITQKIHIAAADCKTAHSFADNANLAIFAGCHIGGHKARRARPGYDDVSFPAHSWLRQD